MGMWKSLQAVRRNVLSIIPDVMTRQPILSGKTGTRWHMITDPTAVRRVLLERLDEYPKSDVTKNLLRPAIGESLFVAEGAHWRWQRRAAAPVFTARNVQNLSPVMTVAANRSVARVHSAVPAAINMMQEMVKVTFDIIAEVTFSGGERFDSQAVHTAIDAYIASAGKVSVLDILGAPNWIPRPARMFTSVSMAQMKRIADQSISDRATRGPGEIPDLLDLLIAGEDPETRRAMREEELRDNLLAFIVAGHETTALTLAWSLYLMGFDSDVQDRARAEIRAVAPDGQITGEQVCDLPLVRAIIDEALRLYPPAALVSRTALADDTLCGREIRKGDTVILPIYAMHRSHLNWPNPDAFVPDRWLQGKPERYSYLPFGDGPRICIGASFALQEAVIVLATLLANFRFTAVHGRDPKPVMVLTLRPEGGVWLQAEPL
jgi:cytochrome P450